MAKTTSDKLQAILDSKEDIRQAINEKGVNCGTSDTLASYADKIRSIKSGFSGFGMIIPGTIVTYLTGVFEAETRTIS